ncbi:Gfo/Idh/MocA family oxidoreductase [Enterococcus hirae]|nr:Gfo/Idh/MocA family oxidoreductase [Enterococcus hirae]
MIRLGVIGTSMISRRFIEAAGATHKYELKAVYSHHLEKAEKLLPDFPKIVYFDDLTDFFAQGKFDVVYIASPNAVHYSQAKQAIEAGKSVIVEKPAFVTPSEMADIIHSANEKKIFFFEGARNLHERGFQAIKQLCQDEAVLGADLTYMKYSARYDQVLRGEKPNIFSLDFGGGALMDLGVYPVYAAVSWFGQPVNSFYYARKISTGVDGMGTAVLRYEDFDVTIHIGKIAQSFHTSEIYTTKGTYILPGVGGINEWRFFERATDKTHVYQAPVYANPLQAEAEDFAKILEHPERPASGEAYEEWVELSRTVNQVLTDLRYSAEIYFPMDDKKE